MQVFLNLWCKAVFSALLQPSVSHDLQKSLEYADLLNIFVETVTFMSRCIKERQNCILLFEFPETNWHNLKGEALFLIKSNNI